MQCIEHGRTKSLTKEGYFKIRYKGNNQYAHRVAYCESKGISLESIRGLLVRHTCDNPRCINPQHLLLGTSQDNMDDMTSRGRQAKGVANGCAKLTEEDVLYIRKHYKPRCKEHGNLVLARRFGVDSAVISRVVNRLSWSHV